MNDSSKVEVPSGRRRFVRKLVSLAALGGVASLLLGERVEKAYVKANVIPEGTNGTIGSFVGTDNNNQVWDNYGVIAGGQNNTAGKNDETGTEVYATVGGGYSNTASEVSATVGGGSTNLASGVQATVGGGYSNTASGDSAMVGGGASNAASGFLATVGGGVFNAAGGSYATVGGGESNAASDKYATVGGGGGNTASYYATVGGGNTNVASGFGATVGGGQSNAASGIDATVGGGVNNTASGWGAFVGGGGYDGTNSGGNQVVGNAATIGGGLNNTATGNYSTVPGGSSNQTAGDYSFAAGNRAKIGTTPSTHNGTFLFADSSVFDFHSVGGNEFAARATGGVRFITGIDGSGNPLPSNTFVMTNAGNFGVGTTSPKAQLHVSGSATADVFCGLGPHPEYLGHGPAMNYGYSGHSLGEGSGFFNVRPDASAVAPNPSLRFMTVDIQRMIITNTGNVGIGATNPTHLIQLSGGAYSDGATWTSVSSVRWKENIEPLTDGVDMLKQLHPVSYNYKKTPAKRTMGFIAEEVGKVLPTVVDWDKAEPGYAEGYDHLAILALAVQALKEQQSTIQQLQEEFKNVDGKLQENEKLQERIAILERTVKQLTAN